MAFSTWLGSPMLQAEPELRAKLRAAMDMLNRDEVDAKRQLELG